MDALRREGGKPAVTPAGRESGGKGMVREPLPRKNAGEAGDLSDPSKVLDGLRQCVLLKGLSNDEITEFIRLFPCHIENFRHGDCIISKDEAQRFIGMVLDGTLGIYTDSSYGGHTLIGIGGRDYHFGFIARFFNDEKSITTLYCRKYSKIAFFAVKKGLSPVDFIRRTNPKILANIYAMLTHHIRNIFDRMHIISSPSVRVRFIRYLLNRHAQTGQTTFDLFFNHSELADYLGVYRTSLSRELTQLSKSGLISMEKSIVSIQRIDDIIEIENKSYARRG
jgi:CRP-like cAMP-binding protein